MKDLAFQYFDLAGSLSFQDLLRRSARELILHRWVRIFFREIGLAAIIADALLPKNTQPVTPNLA